MPSTKQHDGFIVCQKISGFNLLSCAECLYLGKVVSVCEEAHNQDKRRYQISITFSLKISLRFKGKVKINLLTKISLLS